jgi:hypothetical protein
MSRQYEPPRDTDYVPPPRIEEECMEAVYQKIRDVAEELGVDTNRAIQIAEKVRRELL